MMGNAGVGKPSRNRPLKSAVDLLVDVALVVLCPLAIVWDGVLTRTMIDLHMNDFGKFYYSALAYRAGRDMYAPTAATDIGYGTTLGMQFLNMNPPHFQLLMLPLALLQ